MFVVYLCVVMIRKTNAHNTNTWQTIALIGLMMVIGLALRVWFVSVNELQPTNSPADDGDYYQRALRFATSGRYIDDFWLIRPPLHIFLFTTMLRIGIILGDIPGLTLVRAAQIVLSLIAIPIGYDLAKRLYGKRSGFVFAGILAVWYPLVELPTHLFTEPLFIMLLLTHMWLLILWRDHRRWSLLVLSGIMLGLTALTRSVAVYGAPFVVLWLLLETLSHTKQWEPLQQWLFALFKRRTKQANAESKEEEASPLPDWQHVRHIASLLVRRLALFLIPMILVIVPWTVRNYVVYDRFILIDTIGSVNLWLHMEKYDEKGVEIIRQMPQRDRHVFASEDTMRMFQEDPIHFWNMLWRNAWLHFLHIWKAQFLEDFLLKVSFYGRPLRHVMPLGIAGDILWLAFTTASMLAFAAPLRDGMFRWLALCWIGYTMLTVMLFHLEPRYLMPLWLMVSLYGSWALGYPKQLFALLRQHWLSKALAIGLVGAFLLLFFTYRNYPEMIQLGISRESHHAAGVRAYEAGDYDTAVRELQTVFDVQPTFVTSRAELGMALIAQGNLAEAETLLGDDDAQHILVARGMLARAHGDEHEAAKLFTKAEKKSGDNVQRMVMEWGLPPATNYVDIGTGRDMGYIEGFSLPEETATALELSYRWLQGNGHVVVPLEQPITEGAMLSLRLTSGQDHPVPLHITFRSAHTSYTLSPITVSPGRWRTYRVVIPAALQGQQQLDMQFDAPIFIPAHNHWGTNDIRPLSLMVNAVWVSQDAEEEDTP